MFSEFAKGKPLFRLKIGILCQVHFSGLHRFGLFLWFAIIIVQLQHMSWSETVWFVLDFLLFFIHSLTLAEWKDKEDESAFTNFTIVVLFITKYSNHICVRDSRSFVQSSSGDIKEVKAIQPASDTFSIREPRHVRC